jgi:exodeoxyribonuclease V alpha subunit
MLESANYQCKTLSDEQKKAVQGSLHYHVSVITGNAGSGKSSAIKEIDHNLELREVKHAIGSYTGKAVARIKEIIGKKTPMTLDRMIMKFNQIPPFKHLVIDEVSMVTSEILYRFITKFPGNFRITFIGDIDQLQEISWGKLFHALIDCGKIPVFRLTKNYRTSENDKLILGNANQLINPTRDLNYPLEFSNGDGFMQLSGNETTVRTILNTMKNMNLGVDDITCICPYNDNLKELNSAFQDIFLEQSFKIMYEDKLWCIGDRVMMIVNNYEINVMNGEIGKVIKIEDLGVTVSFGDNGNHLFKWKGSNDDGYKPPTKFGDALDEQDMEDNELTIKYLQHAFAISIHKSQGSEYPFVIVYIPSKGEKTSKFVSINLIYTAITRTKKLIYLIGNEKTIADATMQRQSYRYDNLDLRLKLLNPNINLKTQTIQEDENEFDEDKLYEQYGDGQNDE